MKITIYHNVARSAQGVPLGFSGYHPRHPVVPVFAYQPPATERGDDLTQEELLFVVAEEAFEAFNADPDDLPAPAREIAAQYRARQLRSLSVGDLVQIDDEMLVCSPLGFERAHLQPRIVHERHHGTVPLPADVADPSPPHAPVPSRHAPQVAADSFPAAHLLPPTASSAHRPQSGDQGGPDPRRTR